MTPQSFLSPVFNHLKTNTHCFKIKTIILFALAILNAPGSVAQEKHVFTYADPGSKGYSSEKLEELKDHLQTSGASSMMILVDGDVIFEWGDTGKKHLIHSMRKALLNSIFGIAVDRKQIDTSMTLGALNIDDIAPSLSGKELETRVADLLKSRSGIYHDAAAENAAMTRNRPDRGTHDPGEHYYYNNWDFNVAGAILEQQTGKSIYDLFLEEIAIPLGMHDYEGKYISLNIEAEDKPLGAVDGAYQYEPSRSKYPAYHFRMSTRDLALYGQLFMNYGVWNDRQIISREWIDASTKPYSKYNPEYGNAYGMLWNVRIPNENTKRNSFFHTGVGIHMLGVYPDSNMVFVHRVDTENGAPYDQGDFYKMLGLLFGAGPG